MMQAVAIYSLTTAHGGMLVDPRAEELFGTDKKD